MEQYKVKTNYEIISNTDEETVIGEIEKHIFGDYVQNYVRALVIKKDKDIILTWLNALDDKKLSEIKTLIENIMKERENCKWII